MLDSLLVLLAQAVEELEREAAACAFVAVHGRGEHDHVGTQHLLHKRDGDGCGLVNDEQLRLRQLPVVLRLNVLDRLTVVLEDVDSHDGVVEVRICRGEDVIIRVLAV